MQAPAADGLDVFAGGQLQRHFIGRLVLIHRVAWQPLDTEHPRLPPCQQSLLTGGFNPLNAHGLPPINHPNTSRMVTWYSMPVLRNNSKKQMRQQTLAMSGALLVFIWVCLFRPGAAGIRQAELIQALREEMASGSLKVSGHEGENRIRLSDRSSQERFVEALSSGEVYPPGDRMPIGAEVQSTTLEGRQTTFHPWVHPPSNGDGLIVLINAAGKLNGHIGVKLHTEGEMNARASP